MKLMTPGQSLRLIESPSMVPEFFLLPEQVAVRATTESAAACAVLLPPAVGQVNADQQGNSFNRNRRSRLLRVHSSQTSGGALSSDSAAWQSRNHRR